MTELKKRVERKVPVAGLGVMVVSIDRVGVQIRRPGSRRTSAYELPWFNVHGQAARLKAAQAKRDRAKKVALQRAARGGR